MCVDKYSSVFRSRPETPHTGNTPVPGKSPASSTPKLSRATTPQRSISQQSHVLESTTPLTPRTPREAGTLPVIGDTVTEKVKDSKSDSKALPGLKSQQPKKMGSPNLRKDSRNKQPLKKESSLKGKEQSSQLALTEVDGRRGSLVKYNGGDAEVDGRRGSLVKYHGGDEITNNLTSDSTTTIGALSIPNAGYILGTRLYEQRQGFQNVMGSNPDLTQESKYTAQQRPGPLPLECTAAPPPLTRDMVKTLNNFSHPVPPQRQQQPALPTNSLVASSEGRVEPNIPYQQIPTSSTLPTSSRHEMESALGARSEVSAPYLGPLSERSPKMRPISAGSGKSEGLSLEVPDDNAETDSTGEYEMTIPETDPGNEEAPRVTDDKDTVIDTVGEKDEREFVMEECEDQMTRHDPDMEDEVDEMMRPQVKSGEEEQEFEDYVMEDGRNSVELEGEIEMQLEDNSPETVEEMASTQEPAVGDEADFEVDDLERAPEEEDEETFERGATPNSQTTEYLRDDLSATSLIRPESREFLDETLDPEFNALTLSSPRSYNEDDECGELTLKTEIRDAFDTPYLRDYTKTPTGETDSESDTEYEFCNESEDEISVAHHRSDEDDDGNTQI